ncbi:MAG: lysophospholipid acyltransferase family protein [Gemmatimonadales bacterium]
MSVWWMPVRNVIAAVWTWSVLVLTLVLFFPVIMLWRFIGWPVDGMNYLGGRLFRLAGALTARLTPRWHFTVRGTLPADPRHPYVVVANHESFADMLLLCLLPWEMKWLSKVEIMWVPVLGWLMWAARDVGVKRGRASSARLAMAACRVRLAARVSVIIFPEGTRSPTTELLPFKDGAFRLAIDAGVPILPLAIHGTRNAIARRDWRINPATAVVEVLEPEPTAGVDQHELKARVKRRIEAARERLRAEAGEPP